ncbi:MAG: dihydrodipicolinate synthase family protein [Eubacteriales bacterium]|nr:dihydrodipicolinate synthase family protein [Eubacteriales bacterium]
MKVGFVPALGTPTDENGNLVVESYEREIDNMIECGAVGILSMGSMGIQAFLRNEVCVEVAKTAVRAAGGRVPVYVGCMDNSINRARARMASMEELDITAFVFTTPYYEIDSRAQIIKYFKALAASTKHGIVLYDLPGVTQQKITYDMVCELKKECPNLMGIKSADLYMLRHIRLNPDFKDFMTFYSGLDAFDIAYKWGIGNILDGMLPATPYNIKNLIEALDDNRYDDAAKFLDNIIAFRDFFVENDLWPAFSASMNLLGFEGFFAPDWAEPCSPETIEKIRQKMIEIKEL